MGVYCINIVNLCFDENGYSWFCLPALEMVLATGFADITY